MPKLRNWKKKAASRRAALIRWGKIPINRKSNFEVTSDLDVIVFDYIRIHILKQK